MDFFLKINKRACTTIRYTRVGKGTNVVRICIIQNEVFKRNSKETSQSCRIFFLNCRSESLWYVQSCLVFGYSHDFLFKSPQPYCGPLKITLIHKHRVTFFTKFFAIFHEFSIFGNEKTIVRFYFDIICHKSSHQNESQE